MSIYRLQHLSTHEKLNKLNKFKRIYAKTLVKYTKANSNLILIFYFILFFAFGRPREDGIWI